MATTLIMADAMTTLRTEARAPLHWILRSSAATSSMHLSHRGTDRRRMTQNTLGKQTPDYGSRITSVLARPVMWTVITSLSITSPCS
jgi:hypothetical protein